MLFVLRFAHSTPKSRLAAVPLDSRDVTLTICQQMCVSLSSQSNETEFPLIILDTNICILIIISVIL
jgi:hypothetical protein